jgi:hypothetical protein
MAHDIHALRLAADVAEEEAYRARGTAHEAAMQTKHQEARNALNIERVAREFATILREWATNDEWQTMRIDNSRRKGTPLENACASHDYYDANEAMAQAFITVIGRDADIMSDADNDIWNAAWRSAKVQFLGA